MIDGDIEEMYHNVLIDCFNITCMLEGEIEEVHHNALIDCLNLK